MCVNFYVRACLTYIMYMFTHIVCVALSTRSSMDIIYILYHTYSVFIFCMFGIKLIPS